MKYTTELREVLTEVHGVKKSLLFCVPQRTPRLKRTLCD
jgi:hypothetical protein